MSKKIIAGVIKKIRMAEGIVLAASLSHIGLKQPVSIDSTPVIINENVHH